MFSYPLSDIRKFNVPNSNCNVCGLNYEIEPGFYQGAMYVSYAFSIAILTVVGIGLGAFVDNPPVWSYIVLIILLQIIFLPVIYRYSRVVYLHLFGGVKYMEDR